MTIIKHATATSSCTWHMDCRITTWILNKAWKSRDETLSLLRLSKKWEIMELLSVRKDCREYGYGKLFSYTWWNSHWIVHLSLIDQQVRQVACCSQKLMEHYGQTCGFWMKFHWEENLFLQELLVASSSTAGNSNLWWQRTGHFLCLLIRRPRTSVVRHKFWCFRTNHTMVFILR